MHICQLRLKLASYFHAGFELEKDDVKRVYNALKQLRVGQPSKRSENSAKKNVEQFADLVVVIDETTSLFFSQLNSVGFLTHLFLCLNIFVEPSEDSVNISAE